MISNKKGTGIPAYRSGTRTSMMRESFSNKKGLSQVVSTVLMILLTVASVAAIWGGIQSFSSDTLGDTKACYDVYNRVELNNQYTCYDMVNNQTHISISLKEIEIDSLIISLVYGGESTSLKLTNTPTSISNLYPYLGTGPVKLPESEGGKTYTFNKTGRPESIVIAPRINGKQCDASSKLGNLRICN